MKLAKIGVLVANLFCLCTFCINVHALPGDLDTTFDGDGKTTTSIGFNDYPQDVAIQPDGKIVVAGYTSVDSGTTNFDLSLARYNSDGSLDTSFGTGGKVFLSGEAGHQRADAVLILPDGKILAIGRDANRLTLFRFNSNGSVDMTFGANGRVIHAIGDVSWGKDAVLQPDGKIVIAGYVEVTGTAGRFTVFRLNTNGSLDTSFNSIGYNAVVYFGATTEAKTVILQSDGKIVAGGAYNSANLGVWGRFGLDGVLEGGVSALVLSDVYINDVAIQPNGKIVFVGNWRNGLGDYSITRFNSDKTLDVRFGNGGINTIYWTSLGGYISQATSVIIQSSGRIIVGGYMFTSTNIRSYFALTRFGAHGFLDVGFGNGGRVLTGFQTSDQLQATAVQADGKIVAAGSSYNSVEDDYAVARYDAGDSNTAQTRAQYDFDGDGRADVSVYRPSTGAWYIFNSSDSSVTVRTFGIVGDVPVPADFDADAKTDFAIYRPSNGQWWYTYSSTNGSPLSYTFEITGDSLRPGDYNGDGYADIIAYTSGSGVWQRWNGINAQGHEAVTFGIAGDKPVLGDFDGDTKVDPAIYRPSTGVWWYAASSAGGAHRAGRWGLSTDIPAPADYDGDFKTDFAVYRPSEGVWYIFNSSNGSYTILNFGLAEDKPVAADYDGDGKADIAVFRPSTGVWYLMRSTAGFSAMQFGISTDIPTPNAFVP